jgi:glycosyltransferase involved in cell wall biosynthesis
VKRRLRVAYVLTPITFGGSEKVSLNFLKSADRSEFDINPVLFLRPWEEEPYFARQLREMKLRYSVLPVALRESGDFVRPIRCFSNLMSILRKGHFSLVHTNGYLADTVGICASKLLRIPHVATCHGFIANDTKLSFYNWLDREALRLSNRVICVSENLKWSLVAAGVRERKIRVIPNAVTVNKNDSEMHNRRIIARRRLGAEDAELVVGYAGRLSQEKGLKTLLRAFSEVLKSDEKCRLWIVGDGPLRSELQELTMAIGISDHVAFLGFREDVLGIMAGMDAFVLPSLTEGTPMALLEAMSLGLPIVASAVGEIPQIINSGENGLLVSPGETRQLAHAIHKVHDEPSFARRLAESGRRTVEEKHSIGAWVRKIENTYLELLGYSGL